jgi:predicted transcriptional regulator
VYFDYFEFLLHLEELEIERRFDVFNQENVHFNFQNDLYVMAVDDSVRDYSFLEDGSLVRAYTMTCKDVWFFGHVESVKDKKISIKFHAKHRNT